LKGLLDGDSILADVWVRGEISNFRYHVPSGHMYFTLKDSFAQLRAVMFRSDNVRLGFRPDDGLRVIAGGRVTVYESQGHYQLYVRTMEPDGLGSLYLAFEQLKRRLAAEGLFAEEVKRPLPLVPRAVGVVTSPTGAAVQDIITVARRRYPNIRLIISPVTVQGTGAALDIVRGLELVDRLDEVDVIILARGGGSLEELRAFNDEGLARAIRRTRHPVVTGVGHETDVTIADLAADRRAATPSSAAELVVPSKADLARQIGTLVGRLERAARVEVSRRAQLVAALARAACLVDPGRLLDGRRQRVDDLSRELVERMTGTLSKLGNRLGLLVGRLEALSPLKVLGRGYAVCLRSRDRRPVTSVGQVSCGEDVDVLVGDGCLGCRVTGVFPGPVVVGGRKGE